MGKKDVLCIIFIFILAIPIVLKLFDGNINATTDGWTHLFRQVLFDEALKDGQFPPMWAGRAAHGYGSPLFLLYWSSPYYIVELFILLGLGLFNSVNIFFTLCLLFGSVFFYFFIRNFFDEVSSMIGAILYLYAPYRLLMVFVYGAWGEVAALCFGPLMLFWTMRLIKKPDRIGIFFEGVFTLLLTLSHNALAIIFLAMILSLILILSNKKNVFPVLIGIFGGVVSGAFFWITSLTENHLIYISDLAQPIIRFSNYKSILSMIKVIVDDLAGKSAGYTSFTFGVSGTLGIIGILFIFRKSFKNKKIFLLTLIWFFSSLFLVLPVSEVVWSKLPLLQLFLYPYRFLVPMTISGILLSVYFVSFIKIKFIKDFVMLFLILLSIREGLAYIHPSIGSGRVDQDYFYGEQSVFYAPGNGVSIGWHDYIPKTVPENFLKSLEKSGKPKNVIDGDYLFNLNKIKVSSKSLSFDVEARNHTTITANIFYYPGWMAFDNGSEKNVSNNENGLITLDLDEGRHSINLIFGDTPSRKLSKLFSFAGFLIFCIVVYNSKKLRILSV